MQCVGCERLLIRSCLLAPIVFITRFRRMALGHGYVIYKSWLSGVLRVYTRNTPLNHDSNNIYADPLQRGRHFESSGVYFSYTPVRCI